MSNFTIFFADPGTWFFALIIVQNILVFILYKNWKVEPTFNKLRLASCIMLSVILFIFTATAFQFFYENAHRESKVDISPIAELSSEEMGRLEGVLERLLEDDAVKGYNLKWPSGAGHLRENHDFRWVRGDECIDVRVSVFETEQCAINFISSEALYRLSAPAPYRNDFDKFTFLFLENGAEIRLGDSFIPKRFGDLGIPGSWRQMNTAMRLGNIRISMSEERHYLDLDNNVTGDFIKTLCEMLGEENG